MTNCATKFVLDLYILGYVSGILYDKKPGDRFTIDTITENVTSKNLYQVSEVSDTIDLTGTINGFFNIIRTIRVSLITP